MRVQSRLIVSIASFAIATASMVMPASAATSNTTIITKAIKTSTKAALSGSVFTQQYKVMTFSGKTSLTIATADRYKVATDRRLATSIGEISYEHIATELDDEQLALVREVHPLAEWYITTAYPGLLADTLGQNFDDLRYAIAHASGWKTTRSNGSMTYRFNVSDTKIDKNEESWFGLTRATKASAEVVIDSKGRITRVKITGPDKEQYATTETIKYGKQTITAPGQESVISWEQLVAVVPSMEPVIPSGWVRLDDLSASCTTAVAPMRELVDAIPSGLAIAGDDIERLNTALASSHDGCTESEWQRWYDLEFYGWLMGAERTKIDESLVSA
jgi:hypothetical protein